MTEQLSIFSYEDYSIADQSFLKEAVVEIQSRERAIWENAIAIGQKLTEVKDRLPHGQFMPWISKEFQWGDRTARSYMKVAEELGAKRIHGSVLHGIAMKALTAIASASSKLEEPEEKQQLVESVSKANAAKLEIDGKALTESDVRKLIADLTQAQQDIGRLKNNAEMGESAFQLEVANRKQVQALLTAQKETESERIQAVRMAVQEEAEKKLAQETQALEARLANMENELTQLQKNPSPEMEAAIADLAQKKRLLANELAEATEQRNQITARLKDLRDEFTRQEELTILAKNYLLQVEELFDKYSRLQVADLSNEAIAAIQTANQGLLKLHNQMSKAVGDASKIVHMRPVEQPIEVEAL